MPTHLGAKQEKSKGGSWSGLRREAVHLGAHLLPGLSLPACSKSLLAFCWKLQGFLSEIQCSDSQITAVASTHMACFLSAALPLRSTVYALYNTWWHLRIQFSSSFQHFCCDTPAVWHPLIFITQHSTCPISSAMTNSTNFSFFWCPAWWPCMPTCALTGIHLLKDIYTVHHLLLCCRFFALQSPLQIFTLSLHLTQHSLAGFFCCNH